MTNLRSTGVIAALALLLGVVLGWYLTKDPGGDAVFTDSDYGAPYQLSDLVQASPTILRGVVIDLRESKTVLISPVTGTAAGERTEVVWRVRVSEALRGSEFSGTDVEVRATTQLVLAGGDQGSRNLQIDHVSLDAGQEYVLFLTKFSEETGDALGLNGVLSAARVDNEALEFMLTPGYLAELESNGEGLHASFQTDLRRLRTAVTQLPHAPRVNAPDPALVASVQAIETQQAIVAGVIDEVRDGRFVSARAIEARLRELGFEPKGLGDPASCGAAELWFAGYGFEVELGCSE